MMTSALAITSTAHLRGRRVVVLGLARSGLAAARMLADAGAQVTVYDRRPASELGEAAASLAERPVQLALGISPEDAAQLIASAELVVTSPSVSARFPTTDEWLRAALREAETRGTPVLGEVDLFLRLTRAHLLGVTGTKGKTTTTALIGEMLASAGVPHTVGGNIGTPLIERVDELGADDWAVLELSELQLSTISRGVDVAVYTNIGADHLDRHGSIEAYRAVKARLAQLSAADGTVVLNADDPGCVALGQTLPAEAAVRWYGFDDRSLAATVLDGRLLLNGEPLLSAAEVPLPGRHMLSNVMAAALGARLAGADHEAVARAIRGFSGVAHRMETVAERGGVRWVNDSQATIPMAAAASLRAFAPARVVLIAGGRGKGLDYAEVADAARQHARAAVLMGETAGELAALLYGGPPVHRAGSMDEAVALAAGLAQPGDVVLLSPAAASFDMFTDYAARGEAFRAAVLALPHGGGGQ
ncbi:MAG TPA: UDP-N-acetylmuramoyl-L-alanine--D-glutamate ligase [Candidatus Limnocylindria bacterium]|nr:UDP-N-acetylmuramoyl-L-alanine--D-glutamate ligase [Candidatus Limnocylindria bacterium]